MAFFFREGVWHHGIFVSRLNVLMFSEQKASRLWKQVFEQCFDHVDNLEALDVCVSNMMV